MLSEASLTQPATPPNLAELLDGHDLAPDDSIAELVAIRDAAAEE